MKILEECPLSSTHHKTLKTTAFCRYLLYRHSSHNREFHNVNCRFCGAIHNVDRAYISVLSQVIHSVNERKTVQTNMISFVSHGDKTLQRLIGMPGEQEHHICLYRFSIHKPIKSRLARGRLYLPFTTPKSTTKSATLRKLNSGYIRSAFSGTQ